MENRLNGTFEGLSPCSSYTLLHNLRPVSILSCLTYALMSSKTNDNQ